MMTASVQHRHNSVETATRRPVTHGNGQFFPMRNRGLAVKSGQRVPTSPRDNSPKSKPEDESSEEESGTDPESGSDGEEDTIVSEETQEVDKGSDPSGKPPLTSQDAKDLSAAVPPALLDEIKKMIQNELGTLKTMVKTDQPETESRQLEEKHPEDRPRPNSGLRIDTKYKTSRPASSPKRDSAGQSPTSSIRYGSAVGNPSPTRGTPSSPERQVVVRFEDQTTSGTAGQTGTLSSSSKSNSVKCAIDEKWGVLFDDRGFATKRLAQVLKGLANYIIDEFMPQKSIIISPEKMAAFYSLHKLESEVYPFTAIFRCRSKGWCVGIEDLYQDLGCEYYLIPKDAKSRPSVPALTPSGFAAFVVVNMLANPDAEAKRLNNIVSELPINADGVWDGFSERLPKQISRHLFPEKPERKTRRLLDDVMRDFVEEFLPANPAKSPAKQSPPRAEIVAEKRLSASSASTSSPRSTKYMPEQRPASSPRASGFDEERDRGSGSRKGHGSGSTAHDIGGGAPARRDQPPPARLGRAYTDDPSRLSLLATGRSYGNDSEIKLPPPPVGRSSGPVRRRSPPDQYRRSVGDLASTASVPVAASPGVVEREDNYQQYMPTRTDYTPRSSASGLEKVTPRRVAGVQAVGGNPGPTWGEYLTGRQAVSSPRGLTISGKGI